MNATKKRATIPSGAELDLLAIALSEQIARDSGVATIDVLEEIVKTGETLKKGQKKSAASSAKRSGSRSIIGAHTWATSKA